MEFSLVLGKKTTLESRVWDGFLAVKYFEGAEKAKTGRGGSWIGTLAGQASATRVPI
jgi:hypothetical protein